MPSPQPVEMFDNVYPNGSPLLETQRAQLVEYQASFGDEA
jgi:pyruvate dehydrogenase E1 component alpha subunit